VTRAVVNYCKANDIHTVIIGDITNIRRNKNLGKVTNQKLHAPQVTKEYAKKCNRTNRGLYKDQLSVYNADAVGAYNIMRKYFAGCDKEKKVAVKVSWTHPESVWRSHIYRMLGNSITDVVHSLYKVFYLKQSPKFLEISNALCYIEYKERHLLEQMPFSSDSIHSKSGCSQVCILLL
jgi:hypothetical protein